MKFLKFKKVELGFLHSKITKRIFLLFIFCVLLPLALLAYFSISQVSKELHKQSEQRLHTESRHTAMTTIERLILLENDFKLVTANLKMENKNPLETATTSLHEWLKHRFNGFMLVTGKNQIMASLGTITDPPLIKSNQEQHINAGKTLVMTHTNSKGVANIYMVRAVNPEQPSGTLLIGEIHLDYLWRSHELMPLDTDLIVIDENMNLLFSSFQDHIPLREFNDIMLPGSRSRQFSWKHNEDEYMASYKNAFMLSQFMANWFIIQSQSTRSILKPIQNFKILNYLYILLTFMLVLFLSLTQIRRIMMPIKLLQKATRKIKEKDFKYKLEIDSNDEFQELGLAFNDMTDSLLKHIESITTINKIGIALSEEKNSDHFMKVILQGAMKITNADAGFLYSVNDNQQVIMSQIHIKSLDLELDSSIIECNYSFCNSGGSISNEFTSSSIFNDISINIPDIYHTSGFNFSRNFAFDQTLGYKSKSSLSVPMKNHENEIIGVLQLINARNNSTNEILPFSQDDQEVTENLASVAAVALTKNKSLEDFKSLFDSLVELISTAIDEKSPYAGGHSRRVPDLTIMIAEAVNNVNNGAFSYVSMSDDDFYALKTAAMLHDCGKVTVPAHIENKMSKLQTIFDRIHLLDTRFEILKRDIDISLLKKQLASLINNYDPTQSDTDINKQEQLEQIESDKNFLYSCNTGRSHMDESSQKRLRDIADKYKWTDSDGKEKSVISDIELHYLSIPSGTITEEERELINSHVNVTSKMLASLHYPKTLRNVPKFAEVHHERVDGTGYPKGLTQDQIPLEGRIIAIADIFEALTAKDRPYKKRFTLMQALTILGSMKENGHIDPDLFDLFISEKLYMRYAEKYLPPDQIDDVVLNEIPGYAYSHMKE